jgi:cell division protease FtsH
MYSRSKLDYTQLKREGAGEESVHQVEAKADELYTNTLQAMTGYQSTIAAIKDTLLERYVLSKDEVFELLEQLAEPQREAA